ncbi:hemerythrin domain-containing protein [Rhizohabitans arisaemae]|uniref:hemerythrin domain-containing protein n=1 Tax=Rhizohabitans arisaemae TaxID=2720610 RepID=UPI0024B0F163|nr:hemerythrin domain-containing protein [Rhizohabitans arisaemae]
MATPDPAGRRGTPLRVTPTPDDGTRLSAERLWDENSRPTRPVPDPDRLFTPREQEPAQHLVDIHDGLREELTRLRDLIEQVAAGNAEVGAARSLISTMTIRQNTWTLGLYCTTYCRILTGHHTLEDRSVFPHLIKNDPDLEPVITRLEEEHHAIAAVLERVDRALVALVAEPGGIPRLRREIDLLTDALLSHLAYEERELIEPLARFGYH